MDSHKKTKAGFVASYDIRPGNGQGQLWLRRFINLSLTYFLRHLPTYRTETHTAIHWSYGEDYVAVRNNRIHMTHVRTYRHQCQSGRLVTASVNCWRSFLRQLSVTSTSCRCLGSSHQSPSTVQHRLSIQNSNKTAVIEQATKRPHKFSNN